MKARICTLSIALLCVFAASCGGDDGSKKSTASADDMNATANKRLEAATPDYHSYPQYLSCKIDGQLYIAYYTEGHINGVTNALNITSQIVFATSADQVQMNGATKISEINLTFFKLPNKGAGTYTSNKEFYLDGHTSFPDGNGLKEVHFATVAGQSLTVTSYKDRIVAGTFSMDVVDEHAPGHVLKLTDGAFRLMQGGDTKIKADKNGDVNMDSMLHSIN